MDSLASNGESVEDASDWEYIDSHEEVKQRHQDPPILYFRRKMLIGNMRRWNQIRRCLEKNYKDRTAGWQVQYNKECIVS